MRCFIGVPVPVDEDAVEALRARIVDVAPRWRDQKWVPVSNLHVTLAFLGDVLQERLQDVESAVAEALAASQPFTLEPTHIEPRPSASRATMLWMAYDDPDGRTRMLAAVMSESLVCAGFTLERRHFVPHLTLVRSRLRLHAPRLDCTASERARFCVSDPVVSLYSSRLTPGGAHYTRLRTWGWEEYPRRHGE